MLPKALDVVERATDEDYIALLVARNRCGPNLPLAEILHQNAIPSEAFEQCLRSKTFTDTIKRHVRELSESGFGVEAKAALLHEAGLPVVYGILTDQAQPAMARLKAHEMLGDVAGKSKKAAPATASLGTGAGNRYQLIINIGAERIEAFQTSVAAERVFDMPRIDGDPDPEEEDAASVDHDLIIRQSNPAPTLLSSHGWKDEQADEAAAYAP